MAGRSVGAAAAATWFESVRATAMPRAASSQGSGPGGTEGSGGGVGALLREVQELGFPLAEQQEPCVHGVAVFHPCELQRESPQPLSGWCSRAGGDVSADIALHVNEAALDASVGPVLRESAFQAGRAIGDHDGRSG